MYGYVQIGARRRESMSRQKQLRHSEGGVLDEEVMGGGGSDVASVVIQIHKYTNTSTQIQEHKYTDTQIQTQIHKFKYTNSIGRGVMGGGK